MKIIKEAVVERVYWGPGDTYLGVQCETIQVFEEDGFHVGDRVKIYIEKE